MRNFGTGQLPRLREERREQRRRMNRLTALGALAIQLGAIALETEHSSSPWLVKRRLVIAWRAEALLRSPAAAVAGLANAF